MYSKKLEFPQHDVQSKPVRCGVLGFGYSHSVYRVVGIFGGNREIICSKLYNLLLFGIM